MLDDALVQNGNGNEDKANNIVSILVVLDDALVQNENGNEDKANQQSQSLLCWTML